MYIFSHTKGTYFPQGSQGFEVVDKICNDIFFIGCIEGDNYDAVYLL